MTTKDFVFDNGNFFIAISKTRGSFYLLEWWWDERKPYSLLFEQRENAERHAQNLLRPIGKGSV